MSATWVETRRDRWDRKDGAVVKIDHSRECDTSRPWLPNYRGWMAYGPGKEQHNYLGFKKRNSPFKIPRKFKTAQAAIKAVEKQYPL